MTTHRSDFFLIVISKELPPTKKLICSLDAGEIAREYLSPCKGFQWNARELGAVVLNLKSPHDKKSCQQLLAHCKSITGS